MKVSHPMERDWSDRGEQTRYVTPGNGGYRRVRFPPKADIAQLVDAGAQAQAGTRRANAAFRGHQPKELIMWRRRSSGGWGRRRSVGAGRSGLTYSYGTVVLLVSGAILLVLYLTGRLNL